MFFYKKLTVDIYTTKITYSRREFCKKQLFLYTLYCFIAILYLLEMPEQAVISRNSISFTLKFELWEAGMTLEYVLVVVAIISCIASVIGTVYAALTYHKKK